MTYRQKVHALADKLGADVQISTVKGETFDVEVEAPTGKVWACSSDIHALVGWE